MHIVCWKDGSLELSRRVPRGAIPVVSGHGKRLRRLLAAEAAPGPPGRFCLPVILVAASDLDKMYAVRRFRDRLQKALAGPSYKKRGGRLI